MWTLVWLAPVSEATRLLGQLQLRELSLAIRSNDFSEVADKHSFQEAQLRNSVINAALEGIFRGIMGRQVRPVRQVRIAFDNLSRLDTNPTLWGRTDSERLTALDAATQALNARYHKPVVMTAAELALRRLDPAHAQPKAKCPFVPQRKMVKKLWGTDADPLANKAKG